MIDQSGINLLSLIATPLKKVASTQGGEYAGPCPFCNAGKDRFRVQPHRSGGGHWFCRKCNKSGDAIAFIMARDNCDFKTACDSLAVALDDNTKPKSRPNLDRQPTLPYHRQHETACDGELWQERAHAFIDFAESEMWGENKIGLEYLVKRGFTTDSIVHRRLGFSPGNYRDDWGLENEVWLPYGIVIPYEIGEFAKITKIRTRRLDWVAGDSVGKYIPPAGVKNTAYLTRQLLIGDIVVIVESELDAIALKQAIEHPRIVGMATGGTGGARQLSYLALLSLASHVVVAFDNDEAGEIASEYWMKALPNAVRRVPLEHDINDMMLAGVDIAGWLQRGT